MTTTMLRLFQILWLLLFWLTITTQQVMMVNAAVTCETNLDCQDQFGAESSCLWSTKTCSNPFQKGCLRLKGDPTKLLLPKRVCNSNDLKLLQAQAQAQAQQKNDQNIPWQPPPASTATTFSSANDSSVLLDPLVQDDANATTTGVDPSLQDEELELFINASSNNNNNRLLDVDLDLEEEPLTSTKNQDTTTMTNNRQLQTDIFETIEYNKQRKEKVRYESDLCFVSELEYPEIRIHQGDWESSIFLAWITQIILMEVVGVPATVGLTSDMTESASFYARENTLVYSPMAYPWASLETANQVGDCALTNDPCAHVLPEVWGSEYMPYVQNGTMDPPTANGMIAQQSLYIPSFTARQFPSLAIFYGLQGEEHRQFLAETFQRPTTWGDYCTLISTDNCATPHDTALRPPASQQEAAMYFAENATDNTVWYKGYFRATEKNDCTTTTSEQQQQQSSNMTCTGHVVAPPCTWNTYLDQQLYWNKIVGLEISDGPIPPLGTYDATTIRQVWRAANWTRSHVIVGWYQPEAFMQEFFDTDYQFQEILLPPPTSTCLDFRTTVEQRCSADPDVRRGLALGACDNSAQGLVKLIASSLAHFNDDLSEAMKSPAFETISNIQTTELDINTMFQKWTNKNIDLLGNDAREAVCDWVVENYERVLWFVPDGYPREVRSSKYQYQAWYMYLAQIVAIFVGLIAMIGMVLCFIYRETKVMLFAQPLFINLILLGFLFNSIGAFLMAVEPTFETCTTLTWFIVLGYTIELVPVLVKTAAINKLIQSAKKARRVNISRSRLLLNVAVTVTGVIVFLTVWTMLDTIDREETRRIADDDPYVIETDLRCAADQPYWKIVAYSWQVLLLAMAAVLAVQSRNVLKEVNDSTTLGTMVYSHVMFLIARGVFQILYVGSTFPYAGIAALLSFNYSLDAFFAMMIYVYPKFWQAKSEPRNYSQSKIASRVTKTKSKSMDDNLTVLVCTANIGNEEPTQESMEAWIPPLGACDEVTDLHGEPLRPGSTFELIAVGMQESTWKETGPKTTTKADLSEEEILNAMEEHHTATLRQMMQDILGEGYSPVIEDQRGQMRLYIFASNNVVEDITTVRISGANTGIGNVMANKGGIVVTFNYKSTRMSFLTAHLAAHEGDSYYNNRCQNIRTIIRESQTFDLSGKLDAAVSSHHMFVMGDLNFRTKFDGEGKHNDNVRRALDLIESKDYDALYAYDELQQGLKNGDLLLGFKTLPCNFPPTFKVQRQSGLVYKEQRTPSYTDRILFKSAEGLEENLEPLAYEPCIDFITSDHKPVRGAFTIIPNELKGTPFREVDIRLVFHDISCTDLPAADSNGLSDPYLMFLWDAVELSPEDTSFKDKIRKMVVGKSWPRTRSIAKTLNPIWEEERIALSCRNVDVGADAMLFVVAMDADLLALKDDFLGAMALNVQDLISTPNHELEHVLEFDRVLQRGGKFAGRVKFTVDVELTPRGGRPGAGMRGSTFRRSSIMMRNPMLASMRQMNASRRQMNGSKIQLNDDL